MVRCGTSRASHWLLLSAVLFSPRVVHAEDSTEVEARARDAYERGSMAYRRGDYAKAAFEFATADALVPNAVTLRAALDAATLADDPVLGTELLSRADREPPDPDMAKTLDAARARFAHRTGAIVVECPPGPHCLIAIDGVPVEPRAPRVVSVGVHTVSVETSGPLEQRLVEVLADQTLDVAGAPTHSNEPAPRAPARESNGVSPVWFFAALGATAVSAGTTIWSGVDTLQRHASFIDSGCAQSNGAACSSLANEGTSAQTRTNVLLATTAALGVGTAVLGVFVIRWRKFTEHDVALSVTGSGASFSSAF